MAQQQYMAAMANSQAKTRNRRILIGLGVVAVLSLLVVAIFAIFGHTQSNSVVGTWADKSGNVVVQFASDGSCVFYTGGNAQYVYYEVTGTGMITLYDMYHYPGMQGVYKVIGDRLYVGNDASDLQREIAIDDYLVRKR